VAPSIGSGWSIVEQAGVADDVTLDGTQELAGACASGQVEIDGIPFVTYVKEQVLHLPIVLYSTDESDESDEVRTAQGHTVVAIPPLPASTSVSRETMNSIALRASRDAGADIRWPLALNLTSVSTGLTCRQATVLSGHPEGTANAAFWSAVVATGSRLQQILDETAVAMGRFDEEYRMREPGLQARSDLERMSDELGNLELDLGFITVIITRYRFGAVSRMITDYRNDLLELLRIDVLQNGMGQMFTSLGGALRWELTAVETRERAQAEAEARAAEAERRRWSVRALSALTFFLVPPGGVQLVSAASLGQGFQAIQLRVY
jgi:hypothetical protein